MGQKELDMFKAQVEEIFLYATSSSEAIRSLCEAKRAVDRKFSVAYFAKHLGISSRGSFSEVLQGRRNLPRKYVRSLSEILGLSAGQRKYLTILIERDRCRNLQERCKLDRKLEMAKRMLNFRVLKKVESPDQTMFTLKVYASFGLGKQEMHLSDIEAFFGPGKHDAIVASLRSLENAKMIRKQGNGYVPTSGGINLFHDAALARQSLLDAAEQADEWFPRPEDACYRSLVFSAKKDDYHNSLQRILRIYNEEVVRLDSDAGDMIVTFNLQLIPYYGQVRRQKPERILLEGT